MFRPYEKDVNRKTCDIIQEGTENCRTKRSLDKMLSLEKKY